jgi:FMN reductase
LNTATQTLRIVGIGGTIRAHSSSAKALQFCIDAAEALGADVQIFTGDALRLPLYEPGSQDSVQTAMPMITALREADGIIIASPGYHGSISGTVKNLLDFTEDMAHDERPYFDGRSVGCIAVAAGWQAAAATLAALRAVVHSLRGWPTPMGITLNSSSPQFTDLGDCVLPETETALRVMVSQVLGFAALQRRTPLQDVD